jgi:uncharacterized protein (DUF1330 family)
LTGAIADKYADLVPAIIAKFGGKVLVRGGHFQIMITRGDAPIEEFKCQQASSS